VSAVCAAGALAVAAGAAVLGSSVFQESIDAQVPDDVVVAVESVDSYTSSTPPPAPHPPGAELEAELAQALPDASAAPLRVVGVPDPFKGQTWSITGDQTSAASSKIDAYLSSYGYGEDAPVVADPAVLDALQVSASARAALDDGEIVVLAPQLSGKATATDPSGRSHPVRIVPSRFTLGYGATALVPPDQADGFGLPIHVLGTLYDNPHPLTDEERDRLEDIEYDGGLDLVEGTTDTFRHVDLRRAYRPSQPSEAQLELALGGVALVFALFVVGVSLALAAAESKDERDILTIAGAPPSTVARSAGAKAWLMATIGALMAVPVGFLPIVVVHLTSDTSGYADSSFPLVFPSRTVALLVLAVPAILAVVASGSSATAQRLRPVRISTATFE
jgi:hypothetical protein